ncbi:MAG: hypothetical protein GF421_09930 [Candidatus Aminicenantes bacterium]|nr:hypothetical protein [Candidatus Aminicenantes bacterium]
MGDEKEFLEIRSLSPEENRKIMRDIENRLAEKKKKAVFSDKEIREIEDTALEPNLDIKDVLGVWEDMLFKPRKK